MDKNLELLCKHLKGQTVTVRTKEGKLYTGIVHNHTLDASGLSLVTLMSREQGNWTPNPQQFPIPSDQILEVSVLQLQAGHNSRESFKTDEEISSTASVHQRELEKWHGDETAADFNQALELDNEHEGADWNQFVANKELFGVDTNFDEEYERTYTTTLDKNSAFYKERTAKANKIAADIEKSSVKNLHRQEERGQTVVADEEDLFSSVPRDLPPPGLSNPSHTTPTKSEPTLPNLPPSSPTTPKYVIPPRLNQDKPALKTSHEGSRSPKLEPKSVSALGLERSAPKVSDKVATEFLHFTEESKAKKGPHKLEEIEQLRRFSEGYDRKRTGSLKASKNAKGATPPTSGSATPLLSSSTAGETSTASGTPSATAPSTATAGAPAATANQKPAPTQEKKISLNPFAKEFKPGSFSFVKPQPMAQPQPVATLSMVQPVSYYHPYPQPTMNMPHMYQTEVGLSAQSQPMRGPLPGAAVRTHPIYPSERRSLAIDMNQSVADVYNRAQKHNDNQPKRKSPEQTSSKWSSSTSSATAGSAGAPNAGTPPTTPPASPSLNAARSNNAQTSWHTYVPKSPVTMSMGIHVPGPTAPVPVTGYSGPLNAGGAPYAYPPHQPTGNSRNRQPGTGGPTGNSSVPPGSVPMYPYPPTYPGVPYSVAGSVPYAVLPGGGMVGRPPNMNTGNPGAVYYAPSPRYPAPNARGSTGGDGSDNSRNDSADAAPPPVKNNNHHKAKTQNL